MNLRQATIITFVSAASLFTARPTQAGPNDVDYQSLLSCKAGRMVGTMMLTPTAGGEDTYLPTVATISPLGMI